PSDVHDPRTLARCLRDAGALLPTDKIELKRLLSEVAKSEPPVEHVYEAGVGWIEDGKAYVTVDGVIGSPSATIIGVKQSGAVDDKSGRLSVNGNWQAWRDTVAKAAGMSSIMMLAICVAFAGPLLYFMDRSSFAINIFGNTRLGKSIATLMMASFQGIG